MLMHRSRISKLVSASHDGTQALEREVRVKCCNDPWQAGPDW
jgi:hypothetical protein